MEEFKELLGENYKENMSSEDVLNALKGMKLADLSSGKYKSADMVDANEAKLKQQLKEKNDLLKSKLTEEEQSAQLEAQRQAEFEQLKQELAEKNLKISQERAFGLTSEARVNCGIEAENKDFTDFLRNISSEDDVKTESISKYVTNLTKLAYEKGKSDAVKTNLGKIGGAMKTDANGKELSFGAKLAQSTTSFSGNSNKIDYFKN